MTNRRSNIFIASGLPTGLLLGYLLFDVLALPRPTVHAQSSRPVHVSGQALPASATAPTPIEGTALNTDVNANFLVIANTSGSAQTVSVVDCTPTTPFALFTAAPIAATTTWAIPLGGMRFRSCFKWSASATSVQGSLVGTR